MLTKMIGGASCETLKATNDSLIKGLNSSEKLNIHPDIVSIDTMQQIDVSKPSLKQIEANMGKSIVESSVDFRINRPLTAEEKEEMLRYCEYDVESTIEVYKLRQKSYFDTKNALMGLMKEPSDNSYRWNTTTISSNILIGKSTLKKWNTHRVPFSMWRTVEGIPDEVWEMWETATDPKATDDVVMGKGLSKKINAFGCEIVFGIGGLHGAPKKPGVYENVKLADVGSLYPSIIVKLNALDSATQDYDAIRRERLSIKHVDKVKSDALKLVLNSVYGLFKSRYSTLYNPRASATVCIFGQIALFDLASMLWKAGYIPINLNTDGVAYVSGKNPLCDSEEICKAWERKYEGLVLEIDKFSKWVQRDVNNYVALTPEGKIKTKGGDVNKYADNKFFSNNSLRITHIALTEYLIKGTNPIITIVDNLDKPELFQIVLKAGSTYKGVVDANGNYQNKVNRVFAVKENKPHTKLYKLRSDDGLVNFPDSPECMFIWNDSVDKIDIKTFREMIDVDYYQGLVNKKIKGWRR